MPVLASSNAFEKKKLVGEWWLPNQEKKCYGTLYFDLDGEQKLCIIGDLDDRDFSNSPKLPKYAIIHGACWDDGLIRAVTVLDAKCIRRLAPGVHGELLSENDIAFQDVWIGAECYKNKEDIFFSTFCFRLNNLEMWYETSSIFSVNYGGPSNKISAEVTVPEPIDFFSDENVTISLDFWNQPPSSCVGQTESIIRCVPQICISAKKGRMPYYGDKESFEYYFFMIFQLFELFFFGQTFFFSMRGQIPISASGGMAIPFLFQEELLFARDISLKQRKEVLLPDYVLFPYQAIKNNLSVLVLNFHQNYKRISVILDSALSSICTTSYGLNSLPLLLFSMEGLQQTFYHSLGEKESEENKADSSAFEAKKEQIIQLCYTEEQKSFVKQEIRWRKTFRDRLLAILIDQKVVFSFLDDDLCNSLAKDLTKIRNNAAHSGERELAQILSPLYRSQVFFVQFLHVAIIMEACGLPAQVIKSCFENSFNSILRDISAILRNHYGSAKEE